MHEVMTVGDTGQRSVATVGGGPLDEQSSNRLNPQSAARTSDAIAFDIPLSVSFAAEHRAKLAQIKHRLRESGRHGYGFRRRTQDCR